jgi:hypothetical protein
MSKFDIHRCYTCGNNEFEDKMLEYNDHMYCSLVCKLKQERKDDEKIGSAVLDFGQYQSRK